MRTGMLMVPAALILLAAGVAVFAENGENMDGYRELTPFEESVIIGRSTEAPYSGEYVDETSDGTYHCRQCGAALYRSDDKFHSGCGWPSFDMEIDGAVERIPDPDGSRTEIVCTICGGHLGHVFLGEGFTPLDTRHCVNSVSLIFVPSGTTERAVFAAGCFWGVESAFQDVEGVIETTVGYTGGAVTEPSYYDVCSGSTGHAEAVLVEFDPGVVSFEELARLFFEIHDPTTPDRQGVDIGTQYRSAVFYASEEQRQVLEDLTGMLRERGYDVVTQLEPAGEFWPAEEYHQDYYVKQGIGSSCHIRTNRFGD